MTYSIEPRARKYVKGYGFCHLRQNIKTIIWYRTRSSENCFQKVVYKADKFLGNKIADAVNKINDDKIVKPDKNPRNVEEMIITPEKSDEILNKLRKVLL